MFVSAKVLLFTQTSRSWSWGNLQAGCLDWRWPFCKEPTHHAHRETSARATKGLRHLHHTQTCHQHSEAKFTHTKAGPNQTQAAQPVLASTWGTALASLAAGLLLSSTHSFLHSLPNTESGEREGTPPPPQPLPTPPQPRGKNSGQGVVLTARGGGEWP